MHDIVDVYLKVTEIHTKDTHIRRTGLRNSSFLIRNS